MASKCKSRNVKTVSLLPAQAVPVPEPVVHFELQVCGETIKGDSSRQSCWGVFDRLPADFRQEMLLRGSHADIWGDTIWGMTKDAYAPAHGPVLLAYHETGEKGVLRYRHAWDQDPGYLWQVDLDLEVIWDGVSHRVRLCLPNEDTATSYFWALLPIPARDKLAEMRCSPEMLHGIVLELWQMSERYPSEGIASVRIEFPKAPDGWPMKFATDGKCFAYSISEPLAIPYEAHSFILTTVSRLRNFLPFSQAVSLACTLTADAELAPRTTMESPGVVVAAGDIIARFLALMQNE